jgi:tetratricopeptide (TPR) repeat protein
VRHTFAARRVIEAAAVEAAVARIDKASIAALKQIVRDEDAAYARGDRGAGLERSLAFHHRLADLCGNPVLARYTRELVLQSSLAIALYERSGVAHARADHAALVDAIARRDGRRAGRLMAAHVDELASRSRSTARRRVARRDPRRPLTPAARIRGAEATAASRRRPRYNEADEAAPPPARRSCPRNHRRSTRRSPCIGPAARRPRRTPTGRSSPREPGQPDALHGLGVLLRGRGARDEAPSLVSRAIEARPGAAAYHNTRGNIRQRPGAHAAAEAAFRRAIALDRHLAQAHANLGHTLRATGRHDEAVASCRSALALAPTLVSAWAGLGQAQLAAGASTTRSPPSKRRSRTSRARFLCGSCWERPCSMRERSRRPKRTLPRLPQGRRRPRRSAIWDAR